MRPAGRTLLVHRPDVSVADGDLVPVAKLGKGWGRHGDITVRLYNPNSELAWVADVVWLQGDGFPSRTVECSKWHEKAGKLLVRFAGVQGPEDARDLCHLEILVPREDLGDLEDDEIFVSDLIGLKVIDVRLGELGELKHVFNAGSTDVYVVQGGGEEWMIPAVAPFLREVDLEAGVITVQYDEF